MRLDELKKVYFIGIGGISMSSLALILKSRGVSVAGYDFKPSENTRLLEQNEIKVNYEHSPENQDGFNTVVYTAAIAENDPELVCARERRALLLTRAELLGMITGGYAHSIGVAGTHGKSTTTGMLCHIFEEEKADATVLAGAVIPRINSTYKAGTGEVAVFEACEYKNSYHSMRPTIRLVLNCEFDHVDFFGNMDNVIKSFTKYLDTDSGKEENIAVVNYDCEGCKKASEEIKTKKYTFSLCNKNADFYADNITEKSGYPSFDVFAFGEKYCSVSLGVPGNHNVSNAVAAAACAYLCGVSAEAAGKGLSSFGGVKRRFEKLGETAKGAVVIDDYAHHPDEVSATLNAAKKVCKGKVICIFQPHTYTRFNTLMEDFAKALSVADITVMADIYAAREQNDSGVCSADILDKIEGSVYFDSFEKIAEFVKKTADSGDMIITMGAGDIYKIAPMLMN